MELNFQSKSQADLSELEEILKYQQSGRRLSASQMQSVNDYVSRRFSMNSLGVADFGDFDSSRRFSLDVGSINDPNFWFPDGTDATYDQMPSMMSHYFPTRGDAMYNQMPFMMPRRRSSSVAMQNTFNHYGLQTAAMNDFKFGLASKNAAAQSARNMEKRTSLDLLGDVAAARSFESSIPKNEEEDTNAETKAEDRNHVDTEKKEIENMESTTSKQSPSKQSTNIAGRQPVNRRSTLDMIMNGQGTFGDRRSSLSFILSQDFHPLSRSNSMALGHLSNEMQFMPPYEMNNPYAYHMPFNHIQMKDMGQNDPFASQSMFMNQTIHHGRPNKLSYEDLHLLALQEDIFRRQSYENLRQGFEQNTMSQNRGVKKKKNSTDPKKRLKKFTPPKPSKSSVSFMLECESIPSLHLESIKSFTETMKKSQESQISIQVWDKKMGLKRSHSATMTKTTRSRKALRELFELMYTKNYTNRAKI